MALKIQDGRGFPRRQLLKTGLLASAGVTASAWALAGCGPTAQATPAAKNTIILEWQPWRVAWGNGWDQIFYQYTEPFRKKNPGVEIKVSAPSSASNGNGVMAQILAGSSTPDVFSGYGAQDLIEQQVLLNLEPYLKQQHVDLTQFEAGQMAFFSPPSGGVFGLPAEISTVAVMLNIGAINDAGLSLPPTDWTQSEAVALWKGLIAGSGNQRSYGTTIWGNSNGTPGEYLWQTYGASKTNGPFATTSGVATAKGLAFGNWFYPLIPEHVIALNVNGTSVFGSSEIASITLGSWQLFSVVTGMSGVDQWDLWPNPVGPVGYETTYAGHDFYGVNRLSKHPEQAVDFLIWLTTSQAWSEALIKLQLVVPPSKEYAASWVSIAQTVAPPLASKNLSAFVGALQAGYGYGAPYFLYDSNDAYTLMGQYTQAIVNGTTTPSEGLTDAANAITKFETDAAQAAASSSAPASHESSAASKESAKG